jgi:hypothetical protein
MIELPPPATIGKHCPMTFARGRGPPSIVFFWLANIQHGSQSIDGIPKQCFQVLLRREGQTIYRRKYKRYTVRLGGKG